MSPEIKPEFSHEIPLSEIGSKAVHFQLSANEAERAALAKRFDLLSLDQLDANVALVHDDSSILVSGDFVARLSQSCVASDLPVLSDIAESMAIRFVAQSNQPTETEVELEIQDCDTVFHDGRVIDLGEAVAQSLALAIDPFPRSTEADAVLKKAGVLGEHQAGPFAALAALRKGAD